MKVTLKEKGEYEKEITISNVTRICNRYRTIILDIITTGVIKSPIDTFFTKETFFTKDKYELLEVEK